jgi:hypothetical protein
MAKHKKPETEEEAVIDLSRLPDDQRCFTHRAKGAHSVYLRKQKVDTSHKPPLVLVRHIMARVQFGVMFDPFAECGPTGKNKTFRDISPEEAFEALRLKAEDPESPVAFWGKRPMTDEEKEHDRKLKAANQRADEQGAANAKLREYILEQGLPMPEGL